MNTNNTIIDASKKFRPNSPENRQDAVEQQRKDGAQIIKKLNRSGFKVPPQEREKLARNIGRLVHENGIKRKTLALEADMDSKEIYRLTLQGHEKSPSKIGLRANGKQYLSLITAIAKIARLDRADLASRVTYGTSIHPSSSPAISEIEWLMQCIYNLVDGIEEEFNLLNRFKLLSQMKATCKNDEPFALWPSSQPDGKWWTSLPVEEIDKASFWGKTCVEQENADQYMEFENSDWPRVIGFLPHIYLGLSDDFDFDMDYWLVPSDVLEEIGQNKIPNELYLSHPIFGEEKEEFPKLYAWRSKVRERLAEHLGDVTNLKTTWSNEKNRLMFNGNPYENYLTELQKHSNEIYMENTEYESSPFDNNYCDPGYYNSDSITHYWIAIYPNKALTGVVPVLISTNEQYYDNSIEILSTAVLENLLNVQLIGGESLVGKIRRSIEITQGNEEPRLKSEWQRTAIFIEHHPLLMKYLMMGKTENHIKKWRESIHES